MKPTHLSNAPKSAVDAAKEAAQRIAVCRAWLLEIVALPGPKSFTKAELRQEAVRRWNISQSGFDAAWIHAIEDAKRPDWYEPLRRKRKRVPILRN